MPKVDSIENVWLNALQCIDGAMNLDDTKSIQDSIVETECPEKFLEWQESSWMWSRKNINESKCAQDDNLASTSEMFMQYEWLCITILTITVSISESNQV